MRSFRPGHTRPRYLFAGAFALATILAVGTGCGSGASSGGGGQPGGDFPLGATLALSGTYSSFGSVAQAGLKAGVDDVNASGGILGRQVKLIISDHGDSSAKELLAVKDLASQHVQFLSLGSISPIVLAALPYTTQQKLLTFASAGAPNVVDAQQFPYQYQYIESAERRLEVAPEVFKNLGVKKVGIIVSNNPTNTAVGQGLQALLPKFGIDVVGFETFDLTATDVSPQLQKLKSAGADAIFTDGSGNNNMATVTAGMRDISFIVPTVAPGPSSLTGDMSTQIVPAMANDFHAYNYRVTMSTSGEPAKYAAFRAQMAKYGGTANIGNAALFHDQVIMLKWAIETAQKQFGNTSVDSVKKVLDGTSGQFTDIPVDQLLVFGNPRYSATDHTLNNADYSTVWSLLNVAKPANGAYPGEPVIVGGK